MRLDEIQILLIRESFHYLKQLYYRDIFRLYSPNFFLSQITDFSSCSYKKIWTFAYVILFKQFFIPTYLLNSQTPKTNTLFTLYFIQVYCFSKYPHGSRHAQNSLSEYMKSKICSDISSIANRQIW